MGILNCTPDSFSDGGPYMDRTLAVAHAGRMLSEGADMIDVGGESTRPGADAISTEEERRRILPVIRDVREDHPDALISVDTCKPPVAAAALAAGADVVNDVTAARDPAMLDVVARAGAAVVLMHMRGSPRSMQLDTRYTHVVAEVHAHLRERATAARDAGIAAHRIWLDPGIGFGKDDAGNLALLASLPSLAACGHPVVVGPSRKSFIGRITGAPSGDRLPGTLAALLPTLGLSMAVARVHEVGRVVQFLNLAVGIREARA